MTGSILQLVAYGIEDIFLTNDPQITYFKIVYKRHTNFSREEIRQNFLQRPDFETQISATIGKNGDLMEKSYLVINLPDIPSDNNDTTQIAWVRYPGYSLINTISIEIDGRQISKHYGEWMMLWNEMFNDKAQDESFKKMIGDVPELTELSDGKEAYTLYIPLQFWFCRSSANALPLISLQYSDVKINLSLNAWDECLIFSPSHYMICEDNLVAYQQNEYIYQNIDGNIVNGIFRQFDPYSKKLYYNLLSPSNFKSIPPNIINKSKYYIYGMTTGYYATPATQNTNSITINPASYKYDKLKKLILGDTYLLINYIFIDEDERLQFAQSKQDYIIEQLYYTEYNELIGPSNTVRIDINQPCKYIVWVAQQKYIKDSLDYYNYTNTCRHKIPFDEYVYPYSITYNNGDPLPSFDNSLILNETILFNQKERLSYRDSKYFRLNQVYEKCVNTLPNGVHTYFFSLNPKDLQHSGTCNMSKIETIEIKMGLNRVLSTSNIGLFRAYAETYNILRISNGLGAVLFDL
jgi:hypothetical protein